MTDDRLVLPVPIPLPVQQDMECEPRASLLDTINGVLDHYGAEPWKKEKLGDRSKGEVEIIGLEDVVEVNDKRVCLTLRLRAPDGSQNNVPLHVGGTLVYAIPHLCLPGEHNSDQYHIFLTKRWRPELGGFSYELPHALIYEPQGLIGKRMKRSDSPFDAAAYHIVQRFYGTECALAVGASSVHLLGTLLIKGEANRAEVQLITAMLSFTFKRKRGEGEIVRLKWSDLTKLLRGGDMIIDAATIAALHKASTWFKER